MIARRLQLGMTIIAILGRAGVAAAQGAIDRPANLSGEWMGVPGTVYFNFIHRFTTSPAPERKVTNTPTFVVATPLATWMLAGVVYGTNSTLASRYPNEHEYFVRATPWLQRGGSKIDVGVQLGYNDAAQGVDAELGVARTLGRVRLIESARLLRRPEGSGYDAAFGGGAVFRLSQYIAIAGDATSVAGGSIGERTAWSGALQLQLPLTPHTLSLHVSNVGTATLQGTSRGTSQRRYGFEFTIPLTVRRYLGRRPPTVSAIGADTASGPVTHIHIRGLSFHLPDGPLPVGTTIEWQNDDPLAHTVTASDGSFQSTLIEPGRTWRHTFETAGTYSFFCTPHPFMRGAITIR